MAYDALKKPKQQDDEVNPYASLLHGGGGGGAASFSSAPQAQGVTNSKATPGSGLMDGGKTATGYVNFGDIYNANADVSKREAEGRRQQAEGKAKAAQSGLTGAQQQFQSGLTGAAIQSPGAGDFAKASGQQGFYSAPNAYVNSTEGAAAGRAGFAPDQNSIRTGVAQQNTHDAWRQRMEQKAQQEFKAPGGLSDLDAYEQLATDTAAAQDLVNNPLTGLSDMDRDLLGAAGRPGFEKLKQRYGDLTGDLDKANAASVDQFGRAKAESDAALKQYGALLGADDERLKREEAEAESAIKLPAMPGVNGGDTSIGATAGETTTVGGVEMPNELLDQPDGSKPMNDVLRDLGYEFGSGTGVKQFFDELGITVNDLAKLAKMTPEQRKAWVAQRRQERGL